MSARRMAWTRWRANELSRIFFLMTSVTVSLQHTTIACTLHSFAILDARSPCHIIASHRTDTLVFCGRLVALHGFAG